MKNKILLFIGIIFLSVAMVIPVFAQEEKEQITYDPDKGIYFVTYWSQVDSTYYEIPLFPGNESSPDVNATVDKYNDEFRYSYNVFNGEKAVRELYSFSLKLNSNIFDIESPNFEWSYNKIEWKSLIRWAHTNFESETLGILPGNSVDGFFKYSSNQLPALNKAFVSSYWGLGNSPDAGPIGEIALKVDSLLQSTEHIILKTVGPKDPPDPLIPLDFLEKIIEYKVQSCEIGWIENPGICRSLQANLDNVKRQLEQGRTQTAANNLRALLNEVEAIREQQLSPEAYALLRFNGEYLLDKLNEN